MTDKVRLDLNLLEEADNKYGTREVSFPIEIEGKTQYAVLDIDKSFRPTKIMACIEEFIDKILHIKRFHEQYLLDLYEPLLLFMMIKHFTSFPAPIKYTEQAKVIRMLIDNGLLYKIVAEFDEKEVEKLNEVLEEVATDFNSDMDEYVEFLEKSGIKQKLEELQDEDEVS